MGSVTVDPTTIRPESSAARATATAKSASARNAAASASLSLQLSLDALALLTSSLSTSAAVTSTVSSCVLSIASAHDASTESEIHTHIRSSLQCFDAVGWAAGRPSGL